jgi:hypothetical protein
VSRTGDLVVLEGQLTDLRSVSLESPRKGPYEYGQVAENACPLELILTNEGSFQIDRAGRSERVDRSADHPKTRISYCGLSSADA